MAYLQSLTIHSAQCDAEFSQQDQAQPRTVASSISTPSAAAGLSSNPGSTQAAKYAVRLGISAKDPAAFAFAEAQAKQLVSAYETYLGQSGSTTGAGFSFYETYGRIGDTEVGGIEIDALVTPDSGQSGFSASIQRQQTSDEGVEGFMIPLPTSS